MMKLYRGYCALDKATSGMKAVWCDSEDEAVKMISRQCRDGCVGNITEVTDLPYPDEPCHVGNMKSLSLLIGQGYRGQDVSLAISLFEYGMAYVRTQHSWVFIYRSSSYPLMFSRNEYSLEVNPKNEWNWIDNEWDQFELEDGSLPQFPDLVSRLTNWYGHECVFGEGAIQFHIKPQ